MNKKYLFFVVLAGAVALNSCEEPDDNPLVGTWVEAVTEANQSEPKYARNCYGEGPDAGYDGTWIFNNNGSYQWDWEYGSIAGPQLGHSSGTYSLISDSVLVLDVESRYPTGKDTLLVSITREMLVVHQPSCNTFWSKIK